MTMQIDYYRDRSNPVVEARIVVERMGAPAAVWHRIEFVSIGSARVSIELNAAEAADLYHKLKASVEGAPGDG